MLIYLLLMWLSASLVMLGTWLVYIKCHNPGIVDVGWALAIFAAGSVNLVNSAHYYPIWFYFIMAGIWMLRLSGYLYFSRIRKGERDQRYTTLSQRWKHSAAFGFFWNYQLQAIFAFIIALPFFFIVQLTQLTVLGKFGIILIIIGILFETLADIQLSAFKKRPRGRICNVGLWRYSRHPNYFFEWIIWLGFAISALSVPSAWLGLLSPILLLWIMVKVTGPITEQQSVEKRGQAYQDYQRTTSMFIPWKPKDNKRC